MTKTFDLTDTKAVVTGGARGIGLQIVKDFLQAGCSVTLWDYDKETLNATLHELSDWGSKLNGFQVEVTDAGCCNKVAKRTGNTVILLIMQESLETRALKK